ncbi:MAG: polysaccharide biosynthesis protein, partial [Methanobacterium sp.]
VTITDPQMTRFVMGIPQAVDLILKAGEKSEGKEIFILKMSSLNVLDLAEVMIEEFAPIYGFKPKDIEIKIIGKRIGEKLYEELMTEGELSFTSDIEGLYVLNLEKKNQDKDKLDSHYRSDLTQKLSKEEIKQIVREYCL